MAINIAMNPANSSAGWNARNSISLYNEMQAHNFASVRLGRKYYLCTGRDVIDIGNYNDFWRGLNNHRLLQSNDIVTGRELRELIRLCKRYSIHLVQHLIQHGQDQDIAMLKKIRGNMDEQKRFLQSWIQNQ